MGWWEITLIAHRQKLLMSDEGADILGKAFGEVVKVYQRDYSRKPTRSEMRYAIEFVLAAFLGNDLDED